MIAFLLIIYNKIWNIGESDLNIQMKLARKINNLNKRKIKIAK